MSKETFFYLDILKLHWIKGIVHPKLKYCHYLLTHMSFQDFLAYARTMLFEECLVTLYFTVHLLHMMYNYKLCIIT